MHDAWQRAWELACLGRAFYFRERRVRELLYSKFFTPSDFLDWLSAIYCFADWKCLDWNYCVQNPKSEKSRQLFYCKHGHIWSAVSYFPDSSGFSSVEYQHHLILTQFSQSNRGYIFNWNRGADKSKTIEPILFWRTRFNLQYKSFTEPHIFYWISDKSIHILITVPWPTLLEIYVKTSCTTKDLFKIVSWVHNWIVCFHSVWRIQSGLKWPN